MTKDAIRVLIKEARDITDRAKAAERELTPAEETRVNDILAKAEAWKAKAGSPEATRRKVAELDRLPALAGAGSAGNGTAALVNGFETISEALTKSARSSSSGQKSAAKIEVPLRHLVGTKDVDFDDAVDGMGLLVRQGIAIAPTDNRWVFPRFPSLDPGSALHVAEFRQDGAASIDDSGGSAPVERDLLESSDEKAELDVAISFEPEDLKQVAVLIKAVPNALLEAGGAALTAFLSQQMGLALRQAIDAHVVTAIENSGANTSSGSGSNILEELRYAKEEMAAVGANARFAILKPQTAVTLDLIPEIDMPRGYPYGLEAPAISPTISDEFMVDPTLAGVLYLGQVRLESDPYTGFSKNTTDLRAEASLLFVVRNADGLLELTTDESSGS